MRLWNWNTKSTGRPGDFNPGSSDRPSRSVHTVSQSPECSGAVYCNWSCLCVCGSVTTITRNTCIHLHQTGFVGKGSDHLQLIKFWPSCASGMGVCGGAKFLPMPYYSQHAVFASLWALFSFGVFLLACCRQGNHQCSSDGTFVFHRVVRALKLETLPVAVFCRFSLYVLPPSAWLSFR